jgi:hypothetical protein
MPVLSAHEIEKPKIEKPKIEKRPKFSDECATFCQTNPQGVLPFSSEDTGRRTTPPLTAFLIKTYVIINPA